MSRIDKVWGWEEVVVNGPLYCAKFLHVKPGKKCSLHWHPVKDETFTLMDGEVFLQTSMLTPYPAIAMEKSRQYYIPPGLPHRFSSRKGGILLEVSTHHDDADCVRIEPSGDL